MVDKQVEGVINLAGLIGYQSGSVVSRTLVNKKTGTVTVFAFDKGEGLSEHAAPFDAIVNVLDGTAEVSISKKPHILNAGDMIIMPANEHHSLKAIDKFKMLLIMIK
ncbi:cupin domain-containing protein [Candidatus Saganbacteria bacterium]|nr:cupin domain-containing protein [Candidatus Saganbacteria bacterium]